MNLEKNKIIRIKHGKGEDILIENGLMRVARSSHRLKIPKVDNDLAYLAGYHLGDGYLEDIQKTFSRTGKGRYEIDYADADINQIKLIRDILLNKFGKTLRIYKRPNVNLWIGRISSCKVLHWFLYKKLELPFGRRNIITLPNWILHKKEFITNFLSGFFDAEADVSKTTNRIVNGKKYYRLRIQLTQRDKNILVKIKRLLKEHFDIKSDIQRKWDRNAYILRIGSFKMVNKFRQSINFINPTKRKKLSDLIEYF